MTRLHAKWRTMSRGRRILTVLLVPYVVLGVVLVVGGVTDGFDPIVSGALSILTLVLVTANMVVLMRDQNREPLPGRERNAREADERERNERERNERERNEREADERERNERDL